MAFPGTKHLSMNWFIAFTLGGKAVLDVYMRQMYIEWDTQEVAASANHNLRPCLVQK